MKIDMSSQGLVRSCVVATALYVSNIVIGGWLNPGYSHARQFASELGMSNAANPRLFAAGSIVTGLVFFWVAIELHRSLRAASGRIWPSGLAGIFMALFGVNLVFAGLFPLPSKLHSAFGIALLTFLVPWLIAMALWRASASRIGIALQFVATPLIVFTAILQTGVLGGVDGTNIGLAQRVAAGVFFSWLLITALWLQQLMQRRSAAAA